MNDLFLKAMQLFSRKKDSPNMTSTENNDLFWSVSFAFILLIHGLSTPSQI